MKSSLSKLLLYKQWANVLTFEALADLPVEDLLKKRKTKFDNILHTLNHVFVIDDVFKAHLTGGSHAYTARNTEHTPAFNDLWQRQQAMDAWYLEYLDSLSEQAMAENVCFEFIGGGRGAMIREDMILHIVNHGTYHRGLVSDMCYQIPFQLPTNDYPVFLRDRAS